MHKVSPATQQGQELRVAKRWYLTKNPNVKVLKLLSYTRVDLLTIREVNWNNTNITTVLLLWESERGGSERGKGEEEV